MAALAGRARSAGETDPVVLGVRLLVPALLAAAGHLCARHEDDRGPVLAAALGLLLLESVVAGVRDLSRLDHLSLLGGLALGQAVLGVAAGALAWARRGSVAGGLTVPGGLAPGGRGLVVAPLVLLALASLYPSVAGPEIGALQPLIAVLGGAAGLPTLVAAAGIVLLAPVVARATPHAGALALVALGLLTLGRLALLLGDVLAGRVATTLWWWVELVAAAALLVLAARVLGRPRARQ